MAIPAVQRMSIEEFLALPEDFLRHELLDGEHIVTPSGTSRHERAFAAIFGELWIMKRAQGGVEVFGGHGDLHLAENSIVVPDIFLIRSVPGNRPGPWSEFPVPLLVVEILSPSTAQRDRGFKRDSYLEAGVEEYWIVDVDAEVVEVWRQGLVEAEQVRKRLVFSMSNGFGGEIDLEVIWGELR